MENKRSINNKNVKQLLENDYLLIHCLTRWIDNCRRPLMREEKNVLRLPPNSDKNESNYSSTHFNCFSYKKLWKQQYFSGKILTHVDFFKYCKKNARYPSALVQYCLSIVFIHSVYQIVFIHFAYRDFWLTSPLFRFFCIKRDLLEGIRFLW